MGAIRTYQIADNVSKPIFCLATTSDVQDWTTKSRIDLDAGIADVITLRSPG